jgi:SsrA-binding protein
MTKDQGRAAAPGGIKIIVTNRKAQHDYFLSDPIEAGIALQGTEVKSLRAGQANLKDSYVEFREGELILVGLHISPYEAGNRFNHEPERPRKLLLHRREILRWGLRARDKGLTLVPTRLYFKAGKVKVEIALARGKKSYDKREAIAGREVKRELDRALKDARNR